MATSAETIEQTAPELAKAGRTVGSLERLMKTLKATDDPTVMPKSPKGGGAGAVQLQPRHFANYMIAVMAAETVVHAASVVPVYRALIPVRKTIVRTEYAGDEVVTRSKTYQRGKPTLLSSMLPWDNPPNTELGQALENILLNYDAMAADVPILKCAAWWAQPWAEITFRVGNGVTETHAFGPAPDLLQPLLAPSTWVRPPGGCFFLPVPIFSILARLAREGLRAAGYKISSDAAGGTAAEDTKTATPATGGTGPASADTLASQPGGDPVNLAGQSNQQDSGRKKREQSPPPFSPHGSPSFGQTRRMSRYEAF
jgi:hypothetical protein